MVTVSVQCNYKEATGRSVMHYEEDENETLFSSDRLQTH